MTSSTSQVIQDPSSGPRTNENKGLNPLRQFQESLCVALSGPAGPWTSTHSAAPITCHMAGLGWENAPPSSICGPFLPLSSSFPHGCLTLKANAPAHPEAPGDVTPPDPCTFIKERLSGSEERTQTLYLFWLPSLPFHVFHSCAVTEVVYRNAVESENAADVGVRKEPLHSSAGWTGRAHRVGVLCLQSGLSSL